MSRSLVVALLILSGSVVAQEGRLRTVHEGALEGARVLAAPSVEVAMMRRTVIDRLSGRFVLETGTRSLPLSDTERRHELWFAWTPEQARSLLLVPKGEGGSLRVREELVPAAPMTLAVREESSKGRARAAIVEVTARDGGALPRFVDNGLPRAGPWIHVPEAGCELLVPADRSLTLEVWSHPLREGESRTVHPKAGRSISVLLRQGRDRRPKGALLRLPRRDPLLPTPWMRLFEIDDRPPEQPVIPETALLSERRVTSAFDFRSTLQAVVEPRAALPGILPFTRASFASYRTLEGRDLHTDGLVLEITRVVAIGKTIRLEGRVEGAARIQVRGRDGVRAASDAEGTFEIRCDSAAGETLVLCARRATEGDRLSFRAPRAYVPFISPVR